MRLGCKNGKIMAKFIECPSCKKTYNSLAFKKCPFCNHPTPGVEIEQGCEKDLARDGVKLSSWYSFATFILVLALVGLIGLVIFCLNASNPFTGILIPFAVSSVLFISLICAIVQLLAEIKLKIDKIERSTKKEE